MVDEITIAMPALKRARREQGGKVWIQLTTDALPERALAAASRAMSAANQAEDEATGGELRVGGGGVIVSPPGPVLDVDFADEVPAFEAWVRRVAQQLQDQGISGSLTPARKDFSLLDKALPTAFTAAFALRLDPDSVARDRQIHRGATPSWNAPDEVTDHVLATLVPWFLAQPGKTYFRHWGVQMQVDPEYLPGLLRSGIRHGLMTTSSRIESLDAFRHIVLEDLAEGTASLRRSGGSWQDEIAPLVELLIALAPAMEQGAIRYSRVIPGWRSDALNEYPPGVPYGGRGIPPGDDMKDLRGTASRLVPDAYGVQVLTDDHLRNAHDLSAWDITTVVPGRHLVQARDLAPWFGADQPDTAVLARARADFGDMLLNPRNAPRVWER